MQREAAADAAKAAEAEQSGAVRALRKELEASLNGKRKQQTARRGLLERVAALEAKVTAAACAPPHLAPAHAPRAPAPARLPNVARGTGRRSTARRRSGAWRRRWRR